MASLPETTGATFPAVRQIENGEPQAGGLNGLWNEHGKAMIERTNWLKAGLSGMGGDAETITDFNSVAKSSMFYAAAGAANSPNNTFDWRGINIVSQSGTERSQLAFGNGNTVMFRDLDDAGSGWQPWRRVLLDEPTTIRLPYANANAPDFWLIGANIKGVTSVTLGSFTAHYHQIGRLVHLSFGFDIAGFSVLPNDDLTTSFSLDMAAISAAAGWGISIAGSSFGMATVEFNRLGAWDTSSLPFELLANSSTNTLYFGNVDTLMVPAQVSQATGMYVRGAITLYVAG